MADGDTIEHLQMPFGKYRGIAIEEIARDDPHLFSLAGDMDRRYHLAAHKPLGCL
jgi:hypothetical protein